jgi:hypothetical protein
MQQSSSSYKHGIKCMPLSRTEVVPDHDATKAQIRRIWKASDVFSCRITSLQRKGQELERLSKLQEVELQRLKRELHASAQSVHSDGLSELASDIETKNSRILVDISLPEEVRGDSSMFSTPQHQR